MIDVLDVVVPVFAIVALGYAMAARFQLDLNSLTTLALWVTAPALIFSSLAKIDFAAEQWQQMIGGTCFVALISGIAAALFTRRNRSLCRATVLTMAFWNAGNLALPICRLAFGDAGLRLATIVFVTMGTLHATLGVWIAKGHRGGFEVFKVPLIYCSVGGVLVSLTNTTVPRMLAEPIEMLGDMAIPLMLMSLGMQLRKLAITEFGASAWIGVGRIGLGFLAGYVFIHLVPMSVTAQNVLLVNSMMPPAVINFVLASRYGNQPAAVASSIVFSTLISIVTIPLILWILGSSPDLS